VADIRAGERWTIVLLVLVSGCIGPAPQSLDGAADGLDGAAPDDAPNPGSAPDLEPRDGVSSPPDAAIATDPTFDSRPMTLPARLVITPREATFASTATGKASAATTLTVGNDGDDPARGIEIALKGGSASRFHIGKSSCVGTLPSGTTCSVEVTFAPLESGNVSDDLVVSSTVGGQVTCRLSGKGYLPARLTVAPMAHDYSSVLLGQKSSGFTFRVRNEGEVASQKLTTTLLGHDPSQYTIVGNTCYDLLVAAGAECEVAVEFRPTITGALQATLWIVGGADEMVTASLSGTGAAP